METLNLLVDLLGAVILIILFLKHRRGGGGLW